MSAATIKPTRPPVEYLRDEDGAVEVFTTHAEAETVATVIEGASAGVASDGNGYVIRLSKPQR